MSQFGAMLSCLESDRFTASLNDSLEKYLNAIKNDLSDVVSRGIAADIGSTDPVRTS